ncbi:acyl carrier protein [Ancylomarina euxinus]|uniref:Acyl carrier protein n=1 Tax=Ancylomarina euxinus TaxID=2283627 RepID=A0A425Y6H8_9BACT|nr:acyl carrier protein [Ancylomarina euxinus]MCZ4694025.1 acyl carrier protein [Ancylomarina euxinus]MUP14555.1 acyl carrier protein [Ancylomarina euxinus]RRG24104.1 acyl carrier protein [Ancylomarina euxinus]
MIDNKEVKEKILQYILGATSSVENEIKDDTLLFEEGLFDSMGLLFLIDFIRDEFQVETKDDELVVENFASINSISAFIINKIELTESNDSKKLVIIHK